MAWFFVPYKRRTVAGRIGRYCAADDVTTAILADGGAWSEAEILGQYAIVKVRASASTLTQLNGLPNVRRLPVDRLDDPLSSLTNAQRTNLRDFAVSLGYTLAEFNARFPGGIATVTLRELLKFMATRRRLVRYDQPTDTFVDDGPIQPVSDLDEIDVKV